MPTDSFNHDLRSSADSKPQHDLTSRVQSIFFGRWSWILALVFLMLGVSFAGVRAYRRYSIPDGTFDFSNTGMSDFHNGAYLPSMAFVDGVNPYSSVVSQSDVYRMARSAPPYSPIVFMIYAPLTALPIEQADVVFFALNVLLIGVIASFAVGTSEQKFEFMPWLWVFGFFVFSRPGHITLFTGYFTPLLIIGTLLALHYAKTHPWISGAGMLLASAKPTYIIPLVILMVCRRNFRAVSIGVLMCAIGAAVGIGWLAYHSSLGDVIEGIKEGQAAFDSDTTEDPVNTWTRLDLAGMVSKVMAWKPSGVTYLLTMCGLLVVPGIAIWRISDRETNSGATGLSAMIVSLSMLVTIYHHSYDCLLAMVAWGGVTFYGSKGCPELSIWNRRVIAVLLAIPAINYVATLRFRELLGVDNQSAVWNVVASANGTCLLISLVILVYVAILKRFDQQAAPTSNA